MKKSSATAPVDRPGRTALLLACAAFVVYNANFRVISVGDCLPARFLPVAILTEGRLRLEPVLEATGIHRPAPYWIMRSVDGHFVSMYPIVTPLLVAPLYAPAVAVWKLAGSGERRLELMGEVMEKFAASAVAGLSVGLCYLVVRRRLTRNNAILLTLAYAFGTNTWATSSQALWQHGPAELFLLGALLCVTSKPSVPAAVGVGVLGGLIVANRLPDLFLALGICAFAALFWAPRRAWIVALSGTVAALPFFLYNWLTFHDWGGGYAVTLKVTLGSAQAFFRNPLLEGLAGLFLSPGKGLFVYCPFFLFLAGLTVRRIAKRDYRLLSVCLAMAVVMQILVYARTDWSGGYSYGPRFLTDATPVLIFLLIPVVEELSRAGRRVFIAAIAVASLIQAIGVFCYPRGASDVNLDVWTLGQTPFLVEARAGFMPPTFLLYARKIVAGKQDPPL